MCATCGCGDTEMSARQGEPRTEHVAVEERLLARNDAVAAHVRASLAKRHVVAYNLMSSPGAGKTSLLERTVAELARDVCVIEGDQATSHDADRIRAAGARAVQVNTGSGCHLDASMVHRAIHDLEPLDGASLFVENVGNLVCPALFDVGEHARVVVVSVTEGDDKPVKYPHMFAAADVVVVNKVDLLPYVDLDLARLVAQARELRPDVAVLPLSVRTGEGLAGWFGWIAARERAVRPRQEVAR